MGPSWLCAEFAMCRVCYGPCLHVPSLLCAELSLNSGIPSVPIDGRSDRNPRTRQSFTATLKFIHGISRRKFRLRPLKSRDLLSATDVTGIFPSWLYR